MLWRLARRKPNKGPDHDLQVIGLRALKAPGFRNDTYSISRSAFVGRPAVELANESVLFGATKGHQCEPADLIWRDPEDESIAAIGLPSNVK